MGVVALVAIREGALALDEAAAAVARPQLGGLVVFVGAVRDEDGGRRVTGLSYSAHPSALPVLRKVVEEIAAGHPELRLAAVHRVGDLAVGELAVVVAAAAPHRAEAFDAARRLIDELKSRVPIWKHQRFADGGEEWVGTP